MRYLAGGVVVTALGLCACGTSSKNDGSAGAAGDANRSGSSAGGGGGAPEAFAGGSGTGATTSNAAGSNAAGSNAAGSNAAGSNAAGGAAGALGAGSAGEPSDPMGDPKPVEPNLVGLVPTSSQWILYESSPTNGAVYANDIELLDIANNQLHPANPGGAYDVIGGLSPDGRSYFFSDVDASRPSDRIIRLEPTGFVPAQVLEGFVGIAGAYRVLSWSHDSRFAVLSNGAGSVEVADMRLGTRVATEKLSSIVGAFAPVGYSYYYSAALIPMYAPRYARVTQSGSTKPQQLPPDAKGMAFDASGTHLFYALGTDQDGYKLYSLSLADGQASEISILQAGERFDGNYIVPAPNDSVIVQLRVLATSQRLLRRAFTMGATPPAAFSNPAVSEQYTYRSADANLVLVDYADNSLELIRSEPYARRVIAGTFPFSLEGKSYGILGNHAFYVAADNTVHVVDFSDAGDLRDVTVSPSGQAAVPCTDAFASTPQQKLAVVLGGGTETDFVDLTRTPPAVVGSFKPSGAGYHVGCPSWGDSDTALVLGEFNGPAFHQYITRWNAAAPETPVLLPQPVGHVLAAMYR